MVQRDARFFIYTGKEVITMKKDEPFIIYVTLNDGDPRVCDYCNKLLVDENGVAC